MKATPALMGLHIHPAMSRGIKKEPRDFSPGGSEGGGYLLSRFRSTIGAAGFNFSVRDGKRWSPRAIAA